jgi:feruloyl esterase
MRALRPLVYARRNARPGVRSGAIVAAAAALALVLGLLAFGQRPAHGGAANVSDVLKVGNVVSRHTALAVNPAGVPVLRRLRHRRPAGPVRAPAPHADLHRPVPAGRLRWLLRIGRGQPACRKRAGGIDECVPLNNGQFVLGQDDEGHIGGGNVEAWAIDDPMLKVDFGYLSEHVFAVAAKAIIASFYGHAPADSYYDGCSDGGREALMEAQRFPDDFQGIIAGAPAFNQAALNAMEEPYESTADETADGEPILTAAAAQVLHNAVISQCADPGLRDGTIQDPRDCNFSYAAVTCATGTTNTSDC